MSTGAEPDRSAAPPAPELRVEPVRMIDPVDPVVPAGPGPDEVDDARTDTPIDTDAGTADPSDAATVTRHDPEPGADAAVPDSRLTPVEPDVGDEQRGPAATSVAAPAFPLTGADTAAADSVGFAFNLARIEDEGEDADPLLHRARDLGVVGVFDGMGGAGGRVYETASGPRTGAYLASRIVRDVVARRVSDICAAGGDLDGEAVADALHGAVESALVDALSALHAPQSGLRSRLIRALPTTMAVAVVQRREQDGQDWVCHLFWAGDSRVYTLDPTQGAAQLTTDDIRDGSDAMANLRADSVLSNAISADTPFVVHHRRLTVTVPFLLVAATDGAFGYLPSPMHFEHLLLATLRTTATVEQWSSALQQQITAVTGDDAAMAVLGVGADLSMLRDLFASRGQQLENDYVRPLDGVSGDLRRMELEVEILRNRAVQLSADLWSHYRAGYERYQAEPAGEERA